MNKPEQWKNINGFVGEYKISNYGRIKSLKSGEEKLLNPSVKKNGYKLATLCKCGKKKYEYLHRLVAVHFIGDPPSGKNHVLHRDDIKTNNHVSNLYWGDDADNMMDMKRNECLSIGSNRTDSKLTESDVLDIRKRYKRGESNQSELAEVYGVHQVQISRIITGKEWAHVGSIDLGYNKGKKLSEGDVLEIRNAYRIGVFSQSEIADAYNVDPALISKIVNRKIWTHL